MAVFTHVMSYDVDWDRLGTSGRAPRTRETLPDFRESCRVTRLSRVFRWLTGCQRTPGFWGVTGMHIVNEKHLKKHIINKKFMQRYIIHEKPL